MPFNKFLNQTPEDFGAALQVSGFSIRNEYIDHPNKEPFPFDTTYLYLTKVILQS